MNSIIKVMYVMAAFLMVSCNSQKIIEKELLEDKMEMHEVMQGQVSYQMPFTFASVEEYYPFGGYLIVTDADQGLYKEKVYFLTDQVFREFDTYYSYWSKNSENKEDNIADAVFALRWYIDHYTLEWRIDGE